MSDVQLDELHENLVRLMEDNIRHKNDALDAEVFQIARNNQGTKTQKQILALLKSSINVSEVELMQSVTRLINKTS